jgi:hypothetical protein
MILMYFDYSNILLHVEPKMLNRTNANLNLSGEVPNGMKFALLRNQGQG